MISKEYVRIMNDSPMLDRKTEADLILRYRLHGDQTAKDQLTRSFMKYIVKSAKSHKARTTCQLNMDDLISEATMGFLTSLDKLDLSFFDDTPSKKIRLVTYSYHWIRAHLGKSDNNSNSVVQKLGNTKKKIYQALPALIQKHDIKSPLSLKDKIFLAETMNAKMSDLEMVLNIPIGDMDYDENLYEMSAATIFTTDTTAIDNIHYKETRDIVLSMIGQFDHRDQDIIINRILSETPEIVEHFASKYNISRMAVKNIENNIIGKITTVLRQRGMKEWI